LVDFVVIAIAMKDLPNHQSIIILDYDTTYKNLTNSEKSSQYQFNLQLLETNLNILFEAFSQKRQSQSLSTSKCCRIGAIYDQFMSVEKFKENIDVLILNSEFNVSYTQPALGMVYKLIEYDGKPCIKFSEEKGKQTLPGFKFVVRLYDGKKRFRDSFINNF